MSGLRPSPSPNRVAYLDAVRGVAVILMVMAHVVDSWTRDADRQGEPYYSVIFAAGLASPLFLLLAGVALAMLGSSRGRRDGSHAAGAAAAVRRGWEIFVLGLVFRIQAQLLGMGALTNLLKVDILNVMGLSMVGAAGVWGRLPGRTSRVATLAVATVVVAMTTPLVRHAAWLTPLPDPLEAYLRPAGTYGAFALFPWAAFLLAGVVVGDLVEATRLSEARQRLLQIGLLASGAFVAWANWAASFQPALYPRVSFWHDSPAFFGLRLGIALILLPAVYAASRMASEWMREPMVILGRSSLFVYWIHIELVYGVIAEPLKRTVPLNGSLIGTGLLVLTLYLVVRLKNRLLEQHGLPGAWRVLAPVVR
jgi:uncharacterized membrane protein